MRLSLRLSLLGQEARGEPFQTVDARFLGIDDVLDQCLAVGQKKANNSRIARVIPNLHFIGAEISVTHGRKTTGAFPAALRNSNYVHIRGSADPARLWMDGIINFNWGRPLITHLSASSIQYVFRDPFVEMHIATGTEIHRHQHLTVIKS
jgi:hypothetical protein